MRGISEEAPTGLIPWFSKTEGDTYATLLHHPLLFGEIQRSAQEVAHVQHASTPGMTPLKVVLVGLILEGSYPFCALYPDRAGSGCCHHPLGLV